MILNSLCFNLNLKLLIVRIFPNCFMVFKIMLLNGCGTSQGLTLASCSHSLFSPHSLHLTPCTNLLVHLPSVALPPPIHPLSVSGGTILWHRSRHVIFLLKTLQWFPTILGMKPRLFYVSGKGLQAVMPPLLQIQLQPLPTGIAGPATLVLLMGGSVCSG